MAQDIFSALSFITLIVIMGFFVVNFGGTGQLTITKSYETELAICKADLATAVTPTCAPVECKSNDLGTVVFLTITGILWAGAGLFFYVWSMKKNDAADVRLREADEKLRQAQAHQEVVDKAITGLQNKAIAGLKQAARKKGGKA